MAILKWRPKYFVQSKHYQVDKVRAPRRASPPTTQCCIGQGRDVRARNQRPPPPRVRTSQPQGRISRSLDLVEEGLVSTDFWQRRPSPPVFGYVRALQVNTNVQYVFCYSQGLLVLGVMTCDNVIGCERAISREIEETVLYK